MKIKVGNWYYCKLSKGYLKVIRKDLRQYVYCFRLYNLSINNVIDRQIEFIEDYCEEVPKLKAELLEMRLANENK